VAGTPKTAPSPFYPTTLSSSYDSSQAGLLREMRLLLPLQVTFTLDGAGAHTMPPLPKNLLKVLGTPVQTKIMYDVPSTPKTAPGPFHPTTPSKSRPAKTPVTVAAFRKRRSQLAASAFQECAPALPLSETNMSSMRPNQAVGGLTLLPQRQCMSGTVSAEACRTELQYE